MTNNGKLLLGIAALVGSILLFLFARNQVSDFVRISLLAMGIVFVVRALMVKFRG